MTIRKRQVLLYMYKNWEHCYWWGNLDRFKPLDACLRVLQISFTKKTRRTGPLFIPNTSLRNVLLTVYSFFLISKRLLISPHRDQPLTGMCGRCNSGPSDILTLCNGTTTTGSTQNRFIQVGDSCGNKRVNRLVWRKQSFFFMSNIQIILVSLSFFSTMNINIQLKTVFRT